MRDFDYNPKYFSQFEEFYEKYKSNFKIDELYKEYLIKKYNHISFKIDYFYKTYSLRSQFNRFDTTAMKYLAMLLDFIKNKKLFTLNELIVNIEFFPLKYIRIYKDKDDDKKTNIIRLNEDLNKFKFRLEFVFPFIEFVIRRLINEIGNNENLNYTGLSPSGIGSLLEQQILKGIMSENSLIKCNHRNVWGFKHTNNPKQNVNQKYDIYNFHELKLDDIEKNYLDYYFSNYYITPNNPNNEKLDALILVPEPFNNNEQKNYSLISLQMTINKEKIYKKEEYHQSTNIAAAHMEKTYDIKINNQYFIFVLAKEYDNMSTQNNLISMEIPFIFYSTIEKKFFLNKNIQIKGIEGLLKNEFKIENEKNKIKNEYLYNKNLKFIKLKNLLKKKRRKDNNIITNNLFSFARKQNFKNDYCLKIKKVINKINIELNKIQTFKNKQYIIQYAFQIPFSEINNISMYESYFGIFAYSGKLYFFYSNKTDIIELHSKENNKKTNINNILALTYKNINNVPEIEDIHDYVLDEKIQTIENLVNYNTMKPSKVFVYSIFEIDQ